MSITPEWQPRFTIEELQAMNDDQIAQMDNNDLLNARMVASKAGAKDLAMKIFSKMPLAPESLLAAKETMGADWIRQRNLNTSRADAAYGTDWLNG